MTKENFLTFFVVDSIFFQIFTFCRPNGSRRAANYEEGGPPTVGREETLRPVELLRVQLVFGAGRY